MVLNGSKNFLKVEYKPQSALTKEKIECIRQQILGSTSYQIHAYIISVTYIMIMNIEINLLLMLHSPVLTIKYWLSVMILGVIDNFPSYLLCSL